MRARRSALAAVFALVALAAGCSTTPVVKQQTFSAAEGSLDRVAVIPFYPRPDFVRAMAAQGRDADEIAAQVATFVAESLSSQGVKVIAPTDVALACEAAGRPLPRKDPRMAAEITSQEFGATAVLTGEVYRWRERVGDNLGADSAASVGYVMNLYDARVVRRLWTSRFDETQRPLSADVRNLQRYPGGGSRWLTATELARWGAGAATESLVAGQWRSSN